MDKHVSCGLLGDFHGFSSHDTGDTGDFPAKFKPFEVST